MAGSTDLHIEVGPVSQEASSLPNESDKSLLTETSPAGLIDEVGIFSNALAQWWEGEMRGAEKIPVALKLEPIFTQDSIPGLMGWELRLVSNRAITGEQLREYTSRVKQLADGIKESDNAARTQPLRVDVPTE